MRCSNCGWPNEPGTERCVKCNSVLYNSETPMSFSEPIVKTGEGVSEIDESYCPVCGYPANAEMTHCPACNAEINHPASVPPSIPSSLSSSVPPTIPPSEQIGHTVISEISNVDEIPESYNARLSGTVNPWMSPQSNPLKEPPAFTLQRQKWDSEPMATPPMEFSGEEVILNRDNLDPGNNTITSRRQARITCEDGKWCIENLSDQSTTLIRVDRKTPLKDGDVIIMGNRMFCFRSK